MSITMQDAKNMDFSDVADISQPDIPLLTPGEYLKTEFLDELGISAYALARATHMPDSRLSEIINGKRAITADTALRLAKYFGTSAQFWINLQAHYDLEMASREVADDIASIEPYEMA
ncbi:HigA family addiction module antitoxin [Psychrobacter sp. I-STPA10]|uniref:HigA family addiction module antitoxin n=1 Tax=Psychrobacter sp. I-STPA10 TaxID=2585769 RepID=UPI001E4A438D|nr:HigA family addiction module antitoxin [Psychrobacter sp. I-STPA10]